MVQREGSLENLVNFVAASLSLRSYMKDSASESQTDDGQERPGPGWRKTGKPSEWTRTAGPSER